MTSLTMVVDPLESLLYFCPEWRKPQKRFPVFIFPVFEENEENYRFIERKPRKRFPVFPFFRETFFVFFWTRKPRKRFRFRQFLNSVFVVFGFRILLQFCVFVFVFARKENVFEKTFSRFRFSLPTSGLDSST